MSRKIKVRKSLIPAPILARVERNEYVASKIGSFPILTSPPHTPADITTVTGRVTTYYGLHVNGDRDATIKMNAEVKTMDGYYYDTAEYVEKVANENDDASLPVAVGLELYAERGTRKPKSINVYDGDHSGEIYFEFPVIENAVSYSIRIAEVMEGHDPVYVHENSCGITSLLIKGKKPNTRYMLCVAGIFANGEGAFSDPVTFRTKDWQISNS